MRKIKKLKFIIAMIIIMISIVIGTYKIASAYIGKNDNITNLSVNNLYNSGNVYCIEPGQVMDYNITYYRKTKIYINGDEVYFEKYNGTTSGATTLDKKGKGNTTNANNIFAAILYNGGGYGSSQTSKTPTQVAVEQYIGPWVSASGAASWGVTKYWASSGSNNVLENAKESSEEYEYSAEVHYLEHVLHKKQSLIVVYDTSRTPKVPPTVDITVNKIWDDNNNLYNTRPASVQVELYQNGIATGNKGTLSQPSWSYTFTGIPAGYTYSVKEVNTPAGYVASYSGTTITNKLQKTSMKVTKVWDDDNDRDGIRPASVNVILYQNGNQFKSATLNAGNGWTTTFTGLPQYVNGSKANYTVKEQTVPNGYTDTVSGGTITNTHIPEKINVDVKKVWEDYYDSSDDSIDNGVYDFDELRPNSITVTLKANGNMVTKNANGQTITNPITLSGTSNEWIGIFENLYKYENGEEISYTIEEAGCPIEYTSSKSGNATNGYTITNTHIPSYDGYKEIKGQVWVDGAPGKGIKMNGTFGEEDTPLEGITVRLKYIDSNGKSQNFDPVSPARYETKTDANGNYSIKINYDISQNVYKLYEDPTTDKYQESLVEKLATAYVEFEYDGMLYTTINYDETESKAKEDAIRRSEIDGNNNTDIKYNTVDSNMPVLEIEENEKGIAVNLIPLNDTKGYWNWDNRKITANTQKIVSLENTEFEKVENQQKSTEILKYCSGKGQTQRTDATGAWKTIKTGTCSNCTGKEHTLLTCDINTQVIENVNCALFEREQPDVAIFSDLTKVEVEMNSQKYTYLYGVRNTNPDTPEELKVKFQNKDTYTYRRPVNPADIAYINKNDAQMDVYVTYEIKVANLSATLKTTVDEIVNVYDSQYAIDTIKKGNTTLTDKDKEDVTIYEKSENYNQIKLKNLGITLEHGTSANEENTIVIRYKVKNDKIKGLLNDEAPLNNAVEILKYKTTYGEETVYAKQESGGRTDQPYAGYDFDSHPGNAGIKLVGDKLQSTQNLVEYLASDGTKKMGPEDDTDIAPAFVLCKDEPTSVSGIVWEDNKSETYASEPNERLGDGQRQDDENKVNNVKIELLEVDNDGTVKEATLYKIDSNTGNIENEDNIVYSGEKEDGKYTFEGLVTGKEYFIKYTYGNDANEPGVKITTISGNTVNARNYKSTIITEEYMKEIIGTDTLTDDQKKWPLVHAAGYSVAVDNMKKRTEIPALRNGNYDQGINMYAYTKSFIVPLEITLETSGNSDMNGKVKDSEGKEIGNILDKLDFGIIERPREALIVQKTITDFKITLANGQVLVEGDPTAQSLNYVKAIGFKESANMDEVINSVEKRLSVEIDSELIQGAQLEATYKVKVKNNNEIDYDYGESGNYGTEYITTKPLANYYYYGNSTGTNGEMKSTITFIDYLDKDISQSYTDEAGYWSEITIAELNTTLWDNNVEENRYISEDVKNELAKGGYKIFQKESIELGIGDITEQEMKVGKLLTSKNDHPYANYAEIIEIDGKTARTIKGFDKNNKQLDYTPGNYVPAKGESEADDDKVDILITPPTGITNYIITYIIVGVIGLIVISIGIIFIKKKILTK